MAEVYNSVFIGTHIDEYNTRLTELESIVPAHYNTINNLKLSTGLNECVMTGDLGFRSMNLTNTTPTENKWGNSCITFHSNDATNWYGKMEPYSMTNSRKGIKIYGRNPVTEEQSSLLLMQYDDGTKQVITSHPDAWCTKTCTWTATSTVSEILSTSGSQFNITAINYHQWGKVANLAINLTNKNDIQIPVHGNLGDSLVGILNVGKRPLWMTAGSSNGDGEGGPCFYRIRNDNGYIYLCWSNGTGGGRYVSAGGVFILRASYILA